MKKLLVLFLIGFLALPLCLFADDEEAHAEDTEIAEGDEADDASSGKGQFRIKDRTVEIGFLQGRIGFANNFLSTSQIFKERMVIDLDDLGNGFKVNFDLNFIPLSFNYTAKDREWGFGFYTGLEAMGALDLSGKMLTLNRAKNDKSDIVGAAFIDVKGSSFFKVKPINTKFKVNLSTFYPLFYIDPNISYSLDNSGKSTKIDIDYKLRIYTPVSMEDDASSAITSSPGVDIQLGAEYPLAQALGLTEKFGFLDFIVGLDLLNIPIIPGEMKSYTEMAGRIGGEKEIDIDDADIVNTEDNKYGNSPKKIFRPFKMLAWADWKPFDTIPVSFIPTLGFAINPMYHEPGSLEAGVKARFDLANMFITTLGTGYYDRMWKNSIDLIFNLRFVEFNFGVDFRSQDLVKSWSGGGFGANFGFKFGG